MAFVFPGDFTLYLVAGVVTAALALTVLGAGPRKPPNQFFGLFMLLIAGNFVAEFAAKGFALAGDAASVRLAERLGFQFFLLDPPVLLYFTLLYPRRHPWLDRPWAAPAMFLPAALGTLAHLLAPSRFVIYLTPTPTPDAVLEHILARGPSEVYLAACYLAAFGLLLRSWLREEQPAVQRQLALLVLGVGVAVLPRIGLALQWTPVSGNLLGPLWGLPISGVESAERVLLTVPLVALVWAHARRHAPAGRAREVRRVLAAVAGLTLGLLVLGVANLLLFNSPLRPWAEFAGQFPYAARWVLFGAVVGYALLRYQVFDFDVRLRRLAELSAAGVALTLLLAAAFLGGPALEALLGRFGPGQVLALALAAVAAPALARAAAREVGRRLPAEGAGNEVLRRLEFYRASLEAALQDGHLPAAAERDLAPVRRDLGITEEQHRVLLDMVRLEAPGRRGQPGVDARGRVAGRYELGAVLGHGSSGRCLLARDALLGRTVVVKEVPRLGDDVPAVLREARAASRLNHPNIVTVHDVLEAPGVSYLVMEAAEGGNLRARLDRGTASATEAVRVLDGVLAGLEAAHARGIVHGDLKPENVLLGAEGAAKVADFGSAYVPAAGTLASLPTRAGPGTLVYMAPEQVEGAAPTPRSDLFAVGAMAFELLAGGHYLELRGKGDFQVREAIVRGRPRAVPRTVPPALRAWLERSLARDPAARWPDAGAMRDALRRAAGLPPAGAASAAAVGRAPRKPRLPR